MKIIRPTRVPVVYIAGPYRPTKSQIEASNRSGVEDDLENIARDWRDYNIEGAHYAGMEVVKAGGMPLTPHKCTERFDVPPAVLPDDEFIARDIGSYVQFAVDAVWAIEGWRESVGAMLEVLYALRFEVPVLLSIEDVRAFIAYEATRAEIVNKGGWEAWINGFNARFLPTTSALADEIEAALAERGYALGNGLTTEDAESAAFREAAS